MTREKILLRVTYICPNCKGEETYEEWTWADNPTRVESKYLCDRCTPPGTIYTALTPEWITETRRITDRLKPDDAKGESLAVDVMQQIKAREMQSSAHARAWEADRKAEALAYKSTWVKRGRNVNELKDL